MADFTLNQEQYEALIALARQGTAGDEQKTIELEQWLKLIEQQNGIERDFLWVQWQEMSAPLPSMANFPEVWPPQLRHPIELISRRIARADVEAVLEVQAVNPTAVLVTPDPNAQVGWSTLDQYFIT